MKLIYLANARIPTEKAHGLQILTMCDAFCKLGVDTELVVPFRFQTEKMKQVKDIFAHYGLEHKFKITRLPTPDFLPLGNYLPSKVSQLVVNLQFLLFSFVSVLSNKGKKANLYYTRDLSTAYWLDKFGMPFCYEAHVFRKTKNVLRFTTKVAQSAYLKSFAVVTQKLAELYREIGVPEDKTLVLPDGVDLKKFDIAISKQEARERLKLPKDKKIIGYIGRFQTFEQEKGISEMIEAMKYLKNSLRENTLMVFVGGPMEVVPKYLSVIQKHGLALDDFRFVDRVAPTQIPLFLKAFDICAMPFPWSEHYAYAMSPLKMFEYMASSRPVVATNLPSVTEILQNGRNAIIVEPDGSEALAIGIEQVMEDEELAKRIANQAYQDVKQYSWIVRAQRVLDFVTGRREIYAL